MRVVASACTVEVIEGTVDTDALKDKRAAFIAATKFVRTVEGVVPVLQAEVAADAAAWILASKVDT